MKELILTKGRVAIVDDDDYDRLNSHKWHVHFSNKYTTYAGRSIRIEGKTRRVLLHREIMIYLWPESAKLNIDHIDRDGLNNTRANLRFCTTSQNVMASADRVRQNGLPRGVSISPRRRGPDQFMAKIGVGGRHRYLGCFSTIAEAHAVYMAAAKEEYGEFVPRVHRTFDGAIFMSRVN